MRFLLTLLVLTLSSPLIHAVGNIGDHCCDNNQCTTQVTCNTGLTCCYDRPQWMEYIGGTCYDPKNSTCASCPVYNPNHPQTQVCPNSSPTCCGGCIDNTKQCCHHYLSYDFFTCGADQTCCGFDNGQHTCCNKDQQCVNDVCVSAQTTTGQTTGPTLSSTPAPGCVMPGDMMCGTRCYNPIGYVCADPSSSFLCPMAFPSKCGDACYSNTQYSCVNGALQPVQPGGTTGPTTGPTSSTPAPGCVMPGDLACGTRCYNPVGYVCADASSSFLCPIAFPSKCGDACYSDKQYKCVNGQLQQL